MFLGAKEKVKILALDRDGLQAILAGMTDSSTRNLKESRAIHYPGVDTKLPEEPHTVITSDKVLYHKTTHDTAPVYTRERGRQTKVRPLHLAPTTCQPEVLSRLHLMLMSTSEPKTRVVPRRKLRDEIISNLRCDVEGLFTFHDEKVHVRYLRLKPSSGR
ncbi:hypothetical protein ARMSODRAFT_660140 [Armillaria solidipes]|uniref:Uncharacterized protein n=1 Tax=Armillaria solidipes TaxID=1076256 RepID=A0A2H3AV86_9AGAR|nr:hypothetical protein ARMSODRAFT_660140 [Armillaria solidipes]